MGFYKWDWDLAKFRREKLKKSALYLHQTAVGIQ